MHRPGVIPRLAHMPHDHAPQDSRVASAGAQLEIKPTTMTATTNDDAPSEKPAAKASSTAKSSGKSAAKPKRKSKKRTPRKSKYTAATADRHILYQLSVQNVESDIDFVDAPYKELRGKPATSLREDFCGTAHTSCEWVRRRSTNTAVGVDFDQPTLDWGIEHNLGRLKPSQRSRVTLLSKDVRDPGPKARKVDVALAMNFSYWILRNRSDMIEYFRSIRRSLNAGGIFFLDHYGGYESMKEQVEKRDVDGFTYVWDQHRYNPITGDMQCYIHFHFPDGSKMRRAFDYYWRLWTLPEVQEMLKEAGFQRVTVYWEGDDDDGEGNGEFEPRDIGEADPAYLTYIVAER